jgi:hypothetical protein
MYEQDDDHDNSSVALIIYQWQLRVCTFVKAPFCFVGTNIHYVLCASAMDATSRNMWVGAVGTCSLSVQYVCWLFMEFCAEGSWGSLLTLTT